MEYEKKSMSEKLREKKEKFNDWKEYKFAPWYKHIFKPIVKRKKKDIKKSIKKAIKSYRKRKAKRQKRKQYRPENYNINIKNIENVENLNIGGRHQRREMSPIQNNRQLPSTSSYQSNSLRYQKRTPNSRSLEYTPTKPNLELDKLTHRFQELENHYRIGYSSAVIEGCNTLINYLFLRLAEFLGIKYFDVNDLLFEIEERELEFAFYEEAIQYSSYLAQQYRFAEQNRSAQTIFQITSKIMNKLDKIARNINT